MCQHRAGTGPMLAASAQTRPSSGMFTGLVAGPRGQGLYDVRGIKSNSDGLTRICAKPGPGILRLGVVDYYKAWPFNFAY